MAGYRLYRCEQLADISAIVSMRQLGASLREIAEIMSRRGTRHARRQLLERLRHSAQLTLAGAQRSLMGIELALEELEQNAELTTVSLRKRPAIRVACIRARLDSYAEINHVERDLHDAIGSDAMGSLRGVLWHRCADAGALEAEAFVEIRREVRPRGYQTKELPAITAASAYCQSNDEAAERTYDTLRRWMLIQDHRLLGPKREIYRGQMLEIQFPLASHAA